MNDKTKKLLDFFERNMLTIVIISVGGYLLYKFARKGGSADAETRTDELDSTSKQLGNQGQKLSYPAAWYGQKSSQIYQAMFQIGTDEDTVLSVMSELKNDLDVYQLIRAFGTQRQQFTLQYLTLPAFLSSEISAKDVATINRGFNTMGITFRF